MFKRIGTSLLLALTILVLTLNFRATTVYGEPACLTISECTDAASEVRDNIADIMEREAAVSDEITDLNVQITVLRSEIESLGLSLGATILEIEELETEIMDLQVEIAANFKLLEQVEDEIEVLMEGIAERMRLTQRIDNTNTVFVILSESDDLTDFISQLRFLNRIATTDADIMDQLTDLLDLYDNLNETLANQAATLRETQEGLRVRQGELEARQAERKSNEEALMILEGQLREELYDLGAQRMTEEEALAAAEAAREVLERTPPPPVKSTGTTTAPPGELEVNRGLTHPLPGGIITSEFGPRTLDGFHWGIDWALPGFPSILAAASGTVTVNGWNNGYGWYVIIAHNINGQRVDTVYAHFHYQSPIPAGTIVEQGQAIGTQGSTGFSTGPHLHFEVHPGGFSWNNGVNPREWLNP